MIAEELKCLSTLGSTSYLDGELCVPFIVIQKATGFDRAKVRRHVRRLARKGYAKFFRGPWSEDYDRPAGAGYCITRAGQAFLNEQST